MEDKKFTEMSNDELQEKAKSVKMLTSLLAAALIVLFAINIMLAFKKGFSALTVIPIALLPVLILNIKNLKELKKEMRERNLS